MSDKTKQPSREGQDQPAGEARRAAPWRAPTRRVFVTMIGAAAAAIAARGTGLLPEVAVEERPRSTWSGTTRWVGHC